MPDTPKRPDAEVTEELAKGIVRAAIELACIRHNLCFEDSPPMVVEECAEVVEDVWNAMRGIDTCDEEPCDELVALRKVAERAAKRDGDWVIESGEK